MSRDESANQVLAGAASYRVSDFGEGAQVVRKIFFGVSEEGIWRQALLYEIEMNLQHGDADIANRVGRMPIDRLRVFAEECRREVAVDVEKYELQTVEFLPIMGDIDAAVGRANERYKGATGGGVGSFIWDAGKRALTCNLPGRQFERRCDTIDQLESLLAWLEGVIFGFEVWSGLVG
jgi:hypothetical protein